MVTQEGLLRKQQGSRAGQLHYLYDISQSGNFDTFVPFFMPMFNQKSGIIGAYSVGNVT
jgi:hypothetical protein